MLPFCFREFKRPEFIALVKATFEEACTALPPGRDTQSVGALMAEYVLKATGMGEPIPCVRVPGCRRASTKYFDI
jgi:hypothetical protein